MRVEVRLFATLTRHRAGAVSGEPFDLQLPDGASVADLLTSLGIPPEEVHLTMVDGRLVHDRRSCLDDGARIGVFPPVGGG